jgi:hypothetical protein
MWTKQLLGLIRFAAFDCNVLTAQMRAAGCQRQQQLIAQLLKDGRMPADVLNEPGRQVDMNMSPETRKRLRYAPIVTSRNVRRRMLNLAQGQSFALEHGVPVVIWQKPISEKNIALVSEDDISNPSSMVYDYFVRGAPAILLVNVVPHLAISNGTSAKMHSLTWADAAATERNLRRIRAVKPGQIVEVEPPAFVNVVIESTHELPLPRVDPATMERIEDDADNDDVFGAGAGGAADAAAAAAAAALRPRSFLLPMQQWNCQARWVGRAATRRMELPAHKSHMVELAFALTFHKVQGATLECVILDFNFESKRECQFACMYVGITRVKTYDDWFVLPITSPKVLSWILDARADVNARAWQAAAAEAE